MSHISRTSQFSDIETAFIDRAHTVVLCNAATIDSHGRPRSRVLHPIWEGNTGWVTTRHSTPKVAHILHNPAVSLAYIAEPFRPVYVECRAQWVSDLATRERIWAWLRATPEPLGFDPAQTWGDIADPENGLLRLTPWRVEVSDYTGPPTTLIWQAAE